MVAEMTALRTLKKELRASMKHRLSQLSGDSINNQSRQVATTLLSLPEYKKARRISIYLSMPGGEISTSDIVHDAFHQGKSVYVPYIYKVDSPPTDGPKTVMDMVSLHSLEDYEALEPDAWGIPTPSKTSIPGRRKCLNDPEIESNDHARESMNGEHVDMILMPGMAFDRGFARLGHGKGFYDFFLQRFHQMRESESGKSKKMPLLVGLALQEQLLEEGEIPTDASDWRLDALIVGDGSLIRGYEGSK